MYREKYKKISDLLACYFHEDCEISSKGEEGIIHTFLEESSIPDIQDTIDEMEKFLSLKLVDSDVMKIMTYDFRAHTFPSDTSPRVWLELIRDTLKKGLAEKTK